MGTRWNLGEPPHSSNSVPLIIGKGDSAPDRRRRLLQGIEWGQTPCWNVFHLDIKILDHQIVGFLVELAVGRIVGGRCGCRDSGWCCLMRVWFVECVVSGWQRAWCGGWVGFAKSSVSWSAFWFGCWLSTTYSQSSILDYHSIIEPPSRTPVMPSSLFLHSNKPV